MKNTFELISLILGSLGILYLVYMIIGQIPKVFKQNAPKEKLFLYIILVLILVGIVKDKLLFFGWL